MKNSFLVFLAALLLLAGCDRGWQAKYMAESAEDLLHFVQKYVPVVDLVDTTEPMSLAGRYTSGSGLDGSKLYLFPDGAYMYTEWSDYQPETLIDRGIWTVSQNVLRLLSDATLAVKDPRDKLYVPLHYRGNVPYMDPFDFYGRGSDETTDLVLMGSNRDYSRFVENIRNFIREGRTDQDYFEKTFLHCTLRKAETISKQDIDIKKASLAQRVRGY